MLEIETHEPRGTREARADLAEAKEALEQVAKERERLPALLRDAQQRGDFAELRALRDQQQMLQDRSDFAALQLERSQERLAAAELAEAAADRDALAEQLTRAFAEEAVAQQTFERARAARAGLQAQVQALVLTVEERHRQLTAARRQLDEKGA